MIFIHFLAGAVCLKQNDLAPRLRGAAKSFPYQCA